MSPEAGLFLLILAVWVMLLPVTPLLRLPALKSPSQARITVSYPRPSSEALGWRLFCAQADVLIDGQLVGTIGIGKSLTVTLPRGAYTLRVLRNGDPLEGLFHLSEMTVNACPGEIALYHIYHTGAGVRVREAGILKMGLAPTIDAATIVVFWPRTPCDFAMLGPPRADVSVFLDGKRIGYITRGDYITLKIVPGKHRLSVGSGRAYLGASAGLKTPFHMFTKRYFKVTYGGTLEFKELAKGECAPDLAQIRQRLVVNPSS